MTEELNFIVDTFYVWLVLKRLDQPVHVNMIHEKLQAIGNIVNNKDELKEILNEGVKQGKLFKKYPEHGPAFYGLLEWGERFETKNFIDETQDVDGKET